VTRLLLPLLMASCKPDPADSAPAVDPTCALGERQHAWEAFCPEGHDLLAWVDPIIGTAGSGNAVPGPLVPHGFVKLSPDSQVEAGSVDAYEHEAERLEGFSHTHLEGPGGGSNGYSNLLVMPWIGDLPAQATDLSSGFSHDNEQAEPGYYAVTLDEHGVRAELTATAWTGVHRYTFPASDDARLVFDAGHSRGSAIDAEISAAGDRFEGWATFTMHPLLTYLLEDAPGSTGELTLYFHGRFSRSWDEQGVFTRNGSALESAAGDQVSGEDVGAWFSWNTAEGEAIELRLGVSLQSVEQAEANLEAQAESRSLEEIRAEAEDAWACRLGRVRVEGGSEQERTLLYTGLYRAMMQPSSLVEPNGAFVSGTAGEPVTHRACDTRVFYADDWCLWDTFRTTHPLATMVEPETMDDRVASFLHQHQEGGWLPKCTWAATGYSRVMIGNHAVPVLADAVTKGFEDFDQELLWEAVHHTATEDDEAWLTDGICGYLNLGTTPEYVAQGWVSHECDTSQSASMTLEYAFDDWATARVAEALGLGDQAAAFDARSESWRNHWDPEQGFMRGRRRDGGWVEPFDPQGSDDFCESDSWVYSFFVPHDPQALVETMGGEEAFVTRLDTFFDEGHYEPSNEPSFHIPWLYNHSGAPQRATERVHALLEDHFSADPGGLPGNDDAGATSALYVLGAVGLYPMAPGDGVYEITTPLFDRVELVLHPDGAAGSSFVIETTDRAQGVTIQRATIDGEPLEALRIDHGRILEGGVLVLELGP
jgi:predicted alpha-1,2-mannosidase